MLGQNLEFDRRAAHGHLERLPQLLDELVASKVAVIVTMGYPAAVAAKDGSSLPVVVVQAGDPVEDGLVKSFCAPRGGTSLVCRKLPLSFLPSACPC